MSYFGSKDFFLEVAKGNVPGHTVIHKFGRNEDVGSTLEPVADGGVFQTPTATVTLAVISDDANDTAAGTGAREVTLVYLDSNFTEQTGTIATNGTTESTETLSGVLRLLRAYVSSSGTYATLTSSSQKGTITIRVSGAGATWAQIPEVNTSGFAVGQSLIGCYTVPAGYTAYMLKYVLSVDSNKSADLFFFQRENADDIISPYSGILRVKNVYPGASNQFELQHLTNEAYPEKTDLGFIAKAPTSADVSVEFEMMLVAN